MSNFNLLPSLKPGSQPSYIMCWDHARHLMGSLLPTAVQSLEILLVVPINHRCPSPLRVSIVGFCSLGIWLVPHSTEHTPEPGEPEAPHSAISPNAPLLRVGKTLQKEGLVKPWLKPAALAK